MNVPISEIKDLPESERQMRCRERLEEFHMSEAVGPNTNAALRKVLDDKWAMARIAQRGV